MTMNRVWKKVCRRWRSLACDSRGNVAVIFGLAVIPVFGLVGAAVDYSRANSARTALQAAADSTALMLSRDLPRLPESQYGTTGDSYFRNLFTRTDTVVDSVETTYSPTGSNPTLKVTVRAHLESRVIKAVAWGLGGNFSRFDIGTSSTISWGQNRLRVALVLDNTGSMLASSKLTNLKTAAKNLVTQLQGAAATNGDVYVSVIPFSLNVNIGTANANASWIDWTAWDAQNRVDITFNGQTYRNVVVMGNNNYCYQGTQYYYNGSNVSQVGSCSMSTRAGWNGCVMDRGTSTAPGTAVGYDQKIDPAVPGRSETLFPATLSTYCPVQLMPLSYDWTALNGKIDSMVAVGTTNQPIGLVWGWQSLVSGGPLTVPAKESGYQYDDIIILLSDGLNTQDRWYGNGSDSSTDVDARMCTSISNGKCTGGTCKNIQDARITLYTVQVSTSGDPLSSLLRACATDQSKFFFLTSASEIVTTFQQIGTEISKLRISK